MASPRRSNRGGHSSKSKRKDESDDDGGQTRCVCKQQHHEGVMIQCETCKVWQHCPCVGLGNGEVTPDKYYCDSCRPQNHPYKVQNGILISGSKRTPHAQTTPAVPSLKTPVPKKRNTMNSKEASIPVDLMLAQQKWNDEHMDEIEDIAHKSNKRRKKNGSSTHDEDEEHLKSKDEEDAEEIKRALDLEQHHSGSKNSAASKNDKETSASDPSPKSQNHSPSLGSNSRNGGSKKSPKSSPTSTSTSAAQLRSPTPSISAASTKPSSPAESAQSKSSAIVEETPNSPTTTGGKRAMSMEEEDEQSKEHVSRASTVSLNKRRRTTKSDLPSRGESSSREDDLQEESAQALPKLESNMPSRSRKNGPSRTNNKRNISNTGNTNIVNINSASNDINIGSNNTDHEDNQEDDTHQSSEMPMLNSKRSFPRRERNIVRSSSRHSTPASIGATDSGTPQPLAPPAPATIRYPSPKMSIQEMSKRAKQILDYISRVQIDMADRKSKSGCITPVESIDALPKQATRDSDAYKSEPFCLPTAVKIMSISGISLVHGARAHHLPDLDTQETGQQESKEMTIKVPLPGEGHQDEHEHEGHPHQRHDSRRHSSLTHSPGSEFESSMGHEPITPPHQPAEPSDKIELAQVTVETQEVVSSLELMDKLTGDLIRFQERFGACE
ncbi:hypothetical protein BGZ59_002579 [Podila verticillata]|nr:hypothetical protein BGZ59_002579 [Podila verticillata]